MAVFNCGEYRPANKYLRPAARRVPLKVADTVTRRRYFPPPDYRSIERGQRAATLLVVKRVGRVRVCYYSHITRLRTEWYGLGEYKDALRDAREYIRTGVM